MKKYLVPAIFTLLIVGVMFFAIRALVSSSNDASSDDTAAATPAAITDAQKEQFRVGQKTGNDQADIVVTVFGDFECPACKSFEPTLIDIRKQYSDKVLVVFKHFPLFPQPHKNARVSAYASEAAGNQGKFWEMHDKLYDTQEEWASLSDPKSKFVEYAQAIGLDVGTFTKDFEADAGKSNVDRDLALSKELKLSGTPSIFINGEVFDTTTGAPALKQQVEARLNGGSQQ